MTSGHFQRPVRARSFGLPRTAACGDAEVDSWSLCPALGLIALGAEKGESEVGAFDLADPALGFGVCSAGEEVGLQLREAGQHLGIDVQHRAADAGVLVLAEGAVGASAGTEFDLAAVEVLVEHGDVAAGGLDVEVTEQSGSERIEASLQREKSCRFARILSPPFLSDTASVSMKR